MVRFGAKRWSSTPPFFMDTFVVPCCRPIISFFRTASFYSAACYLFFAESFLNLIFKTSQHESEEHYIVIRYFACIFEL